MTDPKKPADWERIEANYRAGILSVREIAAAQGISHTAIQKRAKLGGWTRNLGAKIQAKADALVAKQAVASQVATETAVTERVLIEANAQVVAQIRSQHRVDIGRARSLCTALLTELESQTGNLPGLAALGEMLRAPDENNVDRLNDIYRAVISLPERTKTMKALAETLKHLVGIEREAYGIVAGEREDPAHPRMAEMTDDQLYAIAASGGA